MTTTTPITIEIDNRVAEYERATQIYYRTTFLSKGDKVAATISLLTGLVLFIFLGINWYSVFLIAYAPIGWFNVLSPFKAKVRLTAKGPKFKVNLNITFNQDGLHIQTPTADSKILWSLFSKLLEDEQLFLLVHGKWLYLVIPKRTFKDTAEQNAFRELAGRMIGQGDGMV